MANAKRKKTVPKKSSVAAKSVRSTAKPSKGKTSVPLPAPPDDSDTGRNALGVLLFGLVILTLYLCSIRPEAGSVVYTLQQLLTGLFGGLSYSLPLIFLWLGILVVSAKEGKAISPQRCWLVIALFVCLFAAVELFCCRQIEAGMAVRSYVNFIRYAYQAHRGGGALGAVIAWPLYATLTQWGGLIVIVMIVLIILSYMRKLSLVKLSKMASTRFQEVYAKSQQKRRATAARAIPSEAIPSARNPAKRSAPSTTRSPSAGYSTREANAAERPEGRKSKRSRYDADWSAPGPLHEMYVPRVTDPPPAKNFKRMDRSRSSAARMNPTVARPDGLPRVDLPSTTPKAAARNSGEVLSPRPSFRTEAAPRPAVRPTESSATSPFAIPSTPRDLSQPAVTPTPKPRPTTRPPAETSIAERIGRQVIQHNADPDAVMTHIEATPPERTAQLPRLKPERPVREPDVPLRPAKAPGLSAAPREAPDREPASVSERLSEPVPPKRPAEPLPSFFDSPRARKEEVSQPTPVSKPPVPVKTPESARKPEPTAPVIVEEGYNYPPLDLMRSSPPNPLANTDREDQERAEKLIHTLASFSIQATLTGISHGPAVTRFELAPAPGIKVSRISSLADDLAMNLAAVSLRIEAPIPGKAAVGVEVPNATVETVALRDVLESAEARRNHSRLAVGLGKDNAGRYVVADLAKMPHVLIAGQTGSGKSVCINAIIISILYRATPDEVRLILVDPKMVELSAYNNIPHLLAPVVTDPKKAASALDWAVNEMTQRYKKFVDRGAKDIRSYNAHLLPDELPMPQIVIVIDELADLMMVTPRDVEDAICRLAQLARAAGIHLVIATQRPSVDVITGLIKANIPSRIAFTVSSQVDSRTILDGGGAEKLLGRGDMLYFPSGVNKPIRVQGAWVSEEEVGDVANYVRERHDSDYDEDIIDHMENAARSDGEKADKDAEAKNEIDDLFAEAVRCVVDAGQASISMLQRKLRVGYARAGRLIDEMAARKLVSESEGSKSREVLLTREQYHKMFEEDTDGEEN